MVRQGWDWNLEFLVCNGLHKFHLNKMNLSRTYIARTIHFLYIEERKYLMRVRTNNLLKDGNVFLPNETSNWSFETEGLSFKGAVWFKSFRQLTLREIRNLHGEVNIIVTRNRTHRWIGGWPFELTRSPKLMSNTSAATVDSSVAIQYKHKPWGLTLYQRGCNISTQIIDMK